MSCSRNFSGGRNFFWHGARKKTVMTTRRSLSAVTIKALVAFVVVGTLGLSLIAGPFSLRPSTSGATTTVGSSISVGQTLQVGQRLLSANNAYQLVMQSDGNLVLYPGNTTALGTAIWHTHTFGNPGAYASFDASGGLLIISPTGGILWTSGVPARNGGQLVLSNSGFLQEVNSSNTQVWTSRTAPSVPTPPPVATLPAGQQMRAGQRLVSANNAYQLVMQSDGNLVLYPGNTTALGTAIWHTHTFGNPGAYASFTASSGLVIENAANTVIWRSNTSPGSGSELALVNTPALIELNSSNVKVWGSDTGPISVTTTTAPTTTTTTTAPLTWFLNGNQTMTAGQRLVSTNGQYQLLMQSDGNLVIYPGNTTALGTAYWSTRTSNHPGAYAAFNGSGEFFIYSNTNGILWRTNAAPGAGSKIELTTSGSMIEVNSANTTVWTSNSGASSVGVYAYPDPQSNTIADGWPILGITGGMGTTSNPWVDTSQSSDFNEGMAIQNSGRQVPWLSFWTVSGPGCGSDPLWAAIQGRIAGEAVAKKIDGYANLGLNIKPTYVIFDPEGYPDNHSGLDCSDSQSSARYQAMIEGWVAGLYDVDPSLKGGVYAAQYEVTSYGLLHVQTPAGIVRSGFNSQNQFVPLPGNQALPANVPIPLFLAVAFAYSGNPSSPLINPSPIGGIPYGAAQIAASNIKGIIAFYSTEWVNPNNPSDVRWAPASMECSPSTTPAAIQTLVNWGAAYNTLQFDWGRRCTPNGQVP